MALIMSALGAEAEAHRLPRCDRRERSSNHEANNHEGPPAGNLAPKSPTQVLHHLNAPPNHLRSPPRRTSRSLPSPYLPNAHTPPLVPFHLEHLPHNRPHHLRHPLPDPHPRRPGSHILRRPSSRATRNLRLGSRPPSRQNILQCVLQMSADSCAMCREAGSEAGAAEL